MSNESPRETCSASLPANHQTSFPTACPRFDPVVSSHMEILDVAHSSEGEKKKKVFVAERDGQEFVTADTENSCRLRGNKCFTGLGFS